jgi:hypothetical protein
MSRQVTCRHVNKVYKAGPGAGIPKDGGKNAKIYKNFIPAALALPANQVAG